jgi:Protein of unknwon function (DUF3310)
MVYEAVDHPAHYGGDVPYEPIKVMEAWSDMFHLTVNVMMAIKYLVRAGRKPGVSTEQDLRKALWHVSREIDRVRPEPRP